MTKAEARFKRVVADLIQDGVQPTVLAIRQRLWDETGLVNFSRANELNGRECRWRDEVFVTLPDDHWVIVQHRRNRGCPNGFKREMLAKRAKTKTNCP